jgi:hypothetical protein
MNNWKNYVRADPVPWLLEDENPSVQYYTFVDILGRPESDPGVKGARMRIMDTGIVPEILSHQKNGGYWGKPEFFYVREKYRGTSWQLIVLAELGADGGDERIKRACEFILDNSQDRQSGGFSIHDVRSRRRSHRGVFPCLTGNMVWSLIRLGYFGDRRVESAVDWINTYQRFDDGIARSPTGWPYEKLESCWGRHTCLLGVVKALKALAAIPTCRRSPCTEKTISKGAEFLLKHNLFKRSHDLRHIAKRDWIKLGFPLLWDTDILEMAGILAGLGYKDERMNSAMGRLVSKQDHGGRWRLERTFNGRFHVNVEQKGKPSKWLTLNALRLLKTYYG